MNDGEGRGCRYPAEWDGYLLEYPRGNVGPRSLGIHPVRFTCLDHPARARSYIQEKIQSSIVLNRNPLRLAGYEGQERSSYEKTLASISM